MLKSEPRGSLCAVAFTVIEADLEAFTVLAGWRLTTAMAGLRKANDLFKRSCDVHMTHARSIKRYILLLDFTSSLLK